MSKLLRLTIKGFKSFESVVLDPSSMNILIGPNGAGKSNLISFFRLLSYMIASPSGNLQMYIGESGGGASLLFEGPKRTSQIEAELEIATGKGSNEYKFRLFFASPDTLIFAEEACRFLPQGTSAGRWATFGAGHSEARLLDPRNAAAKQTRTTIAGLLRGLVVYHFQDTSKEARIKRKWSAQDSDYLKFDGANIAAFLHELKNSCGPYYSRIVETIRQVAPFFDDFFLEIQNGTIQLRWKERGSDVIFVANQASDGTLRAMGLITALLQPPSKLPPLVILDEPELGLHPYALKIISGLIKSVATTRQVILATQSPAMLDSFEPSDVVVVERNGSGSNLRRLEPANLGEWLNDYTLSELWNINVFGGRPKERHS